MSKRSKSRNQQNGKNKEQKPRIAASEAAAPVKREDAPIAAAPQTSAPKPSAPKAPAPQASSAASKPPAPKPQAPKAPAPQASSATSKPPAPKAPLPAPQPEPRPYVLDHAVDTMERSFKAAGQGTVAVNRKLIDFAQANLNSSLDHVKDLAAARSPVRIMRLQMEYWHDCLETFANQAQELRALSVELVAKANEPIRQHVRSLPARAA